MAKAGTRIAPKKVQVAPTTSSGTPADRVGYLKGVWDELRKVIWPTPTELWRMTGIVVATVIIFAALVGGADYGLSFVVKQLYTSSSNNTTNNTTAPVNNITTSTPPATPAPSLNGTLPPGVPPPPGSN